MAEEIINRVAESSLVTFDLAPFFPKQEVLGFDLKPYLFMEMILKEKDFREKLKTTDWQPYKNKNVAVFCSVDAIIPAWGFMLVATYLTPVVNKLFFGSIDDMIKNEWLHNIASENLDEYKDKRIIIKGCGDIEIPNYAYFEITKKFFSIAKSIMYGEACSNVPLYKRPT